MLPIKRILIDCPLFLKTAFAARDCDFETFFGENYLRLPVDRGNYKEEKTYTNGGNQYTRSFGILQMQLKAYVREIEVKVVDERAMLYDIIQTLSFQSISADLQTQTPIRLIDFVLPEREDRVSAIAASTATTIVEPYTIRDGLIKNIVANGGTVGDERGNAWIASGFTFRFEEVKLRYQ